MPDRIVEHGEQSELYTECGYDVPAIINAVKEMISSEKQKVVNL